MTANVRLPENKFEELVDIHLIIYLVLTLFQNLCRPLHLINYLSAIDTGV